MIQLDWKGFKGSSEEVYVLLSQRISRFRMVGRILLLKKGPTEKEAGGTFRIHIDDSTIRDSFWFISDVYGYKNFNNVALCRVKYSGTKYWAIRLPAGSITADEHVLYDGEAFDPIEWRVVPGMDVIVEDCKTWSQALQTSGIGDGTTGDGGTGGGGGGTGGGGTSQEIDPVFTHHPAYKITEEQILDFHKALTLSDLSNGLTLDYNNQVLGLYLVSELTPGAMSSEDKYRLDHLEDLFYPIGSNPGGFITEEVDPIFYASPARLIEATDIARWNDAYYWGNHALFGYLTSYTETDPVFTNHPAFNIDHGDIERWNDAAERTPVLKTYADELAMIADQHFQWAHYIYRDLDKDIYYEYLGTLNGDLTDYNVIGGSGASIPVTLQEAYLVSTLPQIETTLGSLVIKNGGLSDSDTVLAIRNLLDVNSISLRADGTIQHADAVELDESATLGQVLAAIDDQTQIINISSSDLTILINNSELETGRVYNIIDFTTIHILTPPTTTITGVPESILALAINSNTLSNNVSSITHPYDRIVIDWTSKLAEDNITPRLGWIVFRHDVKKDISTYFDFRNVRVRRWIFNGFDHERGFAETSATNITLTLTWSANMTATYLTVYRKWEVKFPTGFVHAAGAINLTITKGAFSHTRPLLKKTTLTNTWAANELANKPGPIIYSPSLNAYILMDIYDIGNDRVGYNIARSNVAYTVGNGLRILPGPSYADYLTFSDYAGSQSTHLGVGSVNNFFVGNAVNFTLGGQSTNNTFTGNVLTSAMLGESHNNLFLAQLNWSNIGGEFGSNVVGWNANYVELYKFCINNSFLPGGFNFVAPGTYFWSTSFYGNGWGYIFHGNSVEGSFFGLTGTNRSDMSFDKEINGSIIGYYNSDGVSYRKALNSKFYHTKPLTTDQMESVNIDVVPTPVGTIYAIGIDANKNIVLTGDTSTGGGVNIPPVHRNYASDAAMIADQANQLDHYVYFSTGVYYEYLGTTVGNITDYRSITGTVPDTSTLQEVTDAGNTTTNVIIHAKAVNSNESAIVENITDITGFRVDLTTVSKANLVQSINEVNAWNMEEW